MSQSFFSDELRKADCLGCIAFAHELRQSSAITDEEFALWHQTLKEYYYLVDGSGSNKSLNNSNPFRNCDSFIAKKLKKLATKLKIEPALRLLVARRALLRQVVLKVVCHLALHIDNFKHKEILQKKLEGFKSPYHLLENIPCTAAVACQYLGFQAQPQGALDFAYECSLDMVLLNDLEFIATYIMFQKPEFASQNRKIDSISKLAAKFLKTASNGHNNLLKLTEFSYSQLMVLHGLFNHHGTEAFTKGENNTLPWYLHSHKELQARDKRLL